MKYQIGLCAFLGEKEKDSDLPIFNIELFCVTSVIHLWLLCLWINAGRCLHHC